MCEASEFFNDAPMTFIRDHYTKSKNKQDVMTLVGKSKTPTIIDSNIICLGLRYIDVSKTVYFKAKSIDVVEGWKILVDNSAPLDLYTAIFTFYSLDASVFTEKRITQTPIRESNSVKNNTEPMILELIRLCYWLNRCRNDMDLEAFSIKLIEVKRRLKFKKEKVVRSKFGEPLIKGGQILQNRSEQVEDRLKPIVDFYKGFGFEDYSRNVSILIHELMCAVLIKECGYEVNFIRASSVNKEKRSDILFESYKVELKTFLDSLKSSQNVKLSLL